MGYSQAPNPEPDARLVLDRALESPRGIRVEFKSSGHSQRFRQRCYALRKRERLASMSVFPDPKDPRHAASSYDILSMWRENEEGVQYHGPPRRRSDQPLDDGNWLVIQRLDMSKFNIQEL